MVNRHMVISLIGRPNVGKSSVFNCLMRKQNKALTHNVPGVTRDRHYGLAKIDELANEPVTSCILVDTGGFYPQKVEDQGKSFFNEMIGHAHMAIAESDLVLFTVDVREGILPFDYSIMEYLRSAKKPFWVVVNKFDTEKQRGDEAEFWGLGINENQMFLTSAAHGVGITTLREELHREILAFNNRNEAGPGLSKGVTPRSDVVGKLALIGAPNAGKSTLLNELLGAERALVSNIAGTTVDPIEGYVDFYFGPDSEIFEKAKGQSYRHDQILFQQYDDFRKNNPDLFNEMRNQQEFLGDAQEDLDWEIDEHDAGAGLEDDQQTNDNRLMEQAFSLDNDENDDDQETIATAPNEEEKSAGNYWRSLHFIDTAGIRRKSSTKDFIETHSVYRSLRCITESDVVLLLADATKGIGHQDRRLVDIALEKGKSVILVLNKMDLKNKDFKNDKERKKWVDDLRRDIPWLDYCDIIPISAKMGKGLKPLRESIKRTLLSRKRALPTGEVNRLIYEMIDRNPIVAKGGGSKRFKVKYASMIKSGPPTFLLFSNRSKGIPDHYKRYLKNGIRRHFELANCPIHLILRTGADLENRMKKIGTSTNA